MEHPSKVLIIGLGNPIKGDDGFGTLVLSTLHGQGLGLIPGVTLVNAHTDLINHIESFAYYDRIILIDAVLDSDGSKGVPGALVVVEEKEFLAWPEASPSVHQVSPLLTIKLFRALYPQSRSQITLVGLLVDQIRCWPYYATDQRVSEAASIVRSMI